jgi:hypothetical protein
MKHFRFNLATLLTVIGLLALPLGYLAQAGFVEAQFEIQSNHLDVDNAGVLRGDLVCLCSIPGKETTKMICRIEQSHRADLKLLEPEATYSVRYRWKPPFGLFPEQDAYGMFLTTKLGFRAEDVVGQMKMEFLAEDAVGQMKMVDESVVLVRQK